MNKELIGKFLKALREEKNLTQIQLSSAFSGIYSDALISKWERGQSVPNIDDLKTLSKYFNVSVDEILNGTRYEEVDFEKKYFIYNNDWMSRYSSDDLYNVREEQELLIETRFKEILKKMVGDGLSLSEDKEFDFIVNHFYQIFLPAIECKDELALKNSMLCDEICVWVDDIIDSAHDCLPGGLSDIKFEIYKQTALMHNSTIEEKYWEANKKFVFINRQNIWADINNVIEDRENELKDRLNTLENFEKDILLAALQQTNIVNTLATGSPRGKELYEKQYGRKYNEEQLTKQAIKLLIECGAKLNKVFLGYWKVVTWKHSVIDELEHIHKRYKESLLMPVCENGRYHYFIVDNIEKNRAKLGIKYENELFDETDNELKEWEYLKHFYDVNMYRSHFLNDMRVSRIDSVSEMILNTLIDKIGADNRKTIIWELQKIYHITLYDVGISTDREVIPVGDYFDYFGENPLEYLEDDEDVFFAVYNALPPIEKDLFLTTEFQNKKGVEYLFKLIKRGGNILYTPSDLNITNYDYKDLDKLEGVKPVPELDKAQAVIYQIYDRYSLATYEQYQALINFCRMRQIEMEAKYKEKNPIKYWEYINNNEVLI